MRSRPFVPAAVMAVAFILVLSSAVAAEPGPGPRNQTRDAHAWLTTDGSCEGGGAWSATIDVRMYFHWNPGTTNDVTLVGPETARDVDLTAVVTDCDGTTESVEGGTGDLEQTVPAEQMWIIPLTSAALDDVSAPVLDSDGHATDYSVTFDLTWAVPPDAYRYRDIQAGNLVQENADAVVSGTVELAGLGASFGDSVTFVVGNGHDAFLSSYNAR